MKTVKWVVLPLVLVLVFGSLLGCMAPSDHSGQADKRGTETGSKGKGTKELEEKVVVYSPHGKDILSDFEKQFTEAHPGVKVEWLDIGSQEILDRVRSEKDNPQADIWWGAPSVMFDQAKEEGLLEPYKPSYASALAEEFHAPDFSWSGTSQTPEVIMYNSKQLSAEEVPQDWDDLLDAKWKDKIVIRYPLASGTMRTIYSAMIWRTYKDTNDPQEGYEWLQALDKNTREYSANPEMMYTKIARGEGVLTVWNMPDTVMLKEEKNYPFDFVIPKSGTPVLTEGIALLKGAKHPEAAKAFYEFVNTPEATKLLAEKYYRIPTRNDVTDLPKWITETEIKPMAIDWATFQDKEDEWMDYWDTKIKSGSKEVKE
ncbi:extracellular solute-binding protein [Numidum massiliense]|uniref:extracellular solute-binding protein n=1 Tax=Numidum massiliense TaxID=1522315 RepID=UPI0006D554DB|nr:extracellular solute-binding protein [Numidum massiliense]